MNPVTTALTLNMQLPNIAAVSWAVQGDQLSREIQATLVDGSTAWNPQAGYHGVVRFHKPDGTSGVYDVDEDGNPAVTWTGNVATVKIVHQALTVAGTVLMQLEFYDANEARVTAFGWANNVQPSAVTDDEFLSSDYYNILTLQIAGVLGAAGHSPYIDNVTNHWMIWDSDINDYVDSGVYATGPAPTLQSTSYEYANDASGTTPPASGWSGTRPAPVQGQFSWTKTTLTFDSGTTVYYTVAYQGIDGAGADFVKALIAQEEASTTAANAYAVGAYFILANVLYVATAAIQIGDTITPGTNCTQTTVGAELVGIKNTLNQLESEIGIVVDGKSCALGASQGQYVILKNSTISGLSDGLYTAAQAIPAGEQNVTISMLTGPITGGGLNDLKSAFPYIKQYISGTDDSNDYKDQIAAILNTAAPQNWQLGFYAGSFVNHGPRPGVSDWSGMYQIAKLYDGYYGTKGYLIAQEILFLITYASGSWTVKSIVAT
jgi:hypothetical protein